MKKSKAAIQADIEAKIKTNARGDIKADVVKGILTDILDSTFPTSLSGVANFNLIGQIFTKTFNPPLPSLPLFASATIFFPKESMTVASVETDFESGENFRLTAITAGEHGNLFNLALVESSSVEVNDVGYGIVGTQLKVSVHPDRVSMLDSFNLALLFWGTSLNGQFDFLEMQNCQDANPDYSVGSFFNEKYPHLRPVYQKGGASVSQTWIAGTNRFSYARTGDPSGTVIFYDQSEQGWRIEGPGYRLIGGNGRTPLHVSEWRKFMMEDEAVVNCTITGAGTQNGMTGLTFFEVAQAVYRPRLGPAKYTFSLVAPATYTSKAATEDGIAFSGGFGSGIPVSVVSLGQDKIEFVVGPVGRSITGSKIHWKVEY